MTALERRWVESEWEQGCFPEFQWRIVGDGAESLRIDSFRHFVYGAIYVDGGAFVGPDVFAVAEAKADAESMYRQWVYDEYGVVLS